MKMLQGLFRTVPVWLLAAAVVAAFGAACLAQRAAEDPAPAAKGAAPAKTAEPDEEKIAKMTFLELLRKGRWFMLPIGLCSLLGLAIIIERLIALRRSAVLPAGFMDGLKSAFTQGLQDRQAGLGYCRSHDCPLARVAAAGVRKLHRGEEAVEAAIEDAGANEVSKLRRNLRLLYGVSAVAPMLGLLGTVWGMIGAFQVASVMGTGRADKLATGIYEALVTTFAGLTIAIPVLIFYYYFLSKIDMIVHEMNDRSVEFIEHYLGQPAAAAAEVA